MCRLLFIDQIGSNQQIPTWQSVSDNRDNQSMLIIFFVLYLTSFSISCLIDSSMTTVNMQWNNCGAVLSVA